MWIWIIIIAVVIGALVGYLNRGNIEDAFRGAMAGGCLALATGCLIRIAIAAIGILFILWLFRMLFC